MNDRQMQKLLGHPHPVCVQTDVLDAPYIYSGRGQAQEIAELLQSHGFAREVDVSTAGVAIIELGANADVAAIQALLDGTP